MKEALVSSFFIRWAGGRFWRVLPVFVEPYSPPKKSSFL
jgi:hypothetical protein